MTVGSPTRWALVALLALLATACAEAPAGSQAPPGGGGGPPPAKVGVAAARSGVLDTQRTFLGYARPLQTAALAAAVTGMVERVNGRAGDRVAEGDALVVLDRALIEPALAGARAEQLRIEAELRQARRELERARSLPHPVVTDAEREKFSARVEMLDAELRGRVAAVKRLQAESDRHTVRAPFAGVISRRRVEPGQWLSPGQPVVDLVSADTLQIDVDVAADLLPHLRVGGKAKLTGVPEVSASIAGIVPALDEVTRTARVRLTPDEAAPWLLPGVPVDVRFPLSVGDGVLVSRDALVRGPQGVRVVKVVDGKAESIAVEVKASAGEQAVVVGEIAPGDQIVVRGNERVRPGQPLEIVE
ncbi:MAG: efflux RND transporter periplasmic adaptor subunit [Myxococcales bacterium]|nr:efflux RND transporter periplasmic adaptor subunit [Myxococcales bacterium]